MCFGVYGVAVFISRYESTVGVSDHMRTDVRARGPGAAEPLRVDRRADMDTKEQLAFRLSVPWRQLGGCTVLQLSGHSAQPHGE